MSTITILKVREVRDKILPSLCPSSTVGHLKVTLLYCRQRHLLVLRYAALIIYMASPCYFFCVLRVLCMKSSSIN